MRRRREPFGRRSSWIFPAAVMSTVVIGVVTVVVIGTLVARGDVSVPGLSASPGGCERTVRVVTASSFTPVLEAIAPELRRAEQCVNLDVTTVDGRAAAERVERIDADVWIPDDSSWAGVAGTTKLAGKDTANAGTVLATSPIYMVTDRATGDRLQAAGGSWLALATLLVTPNSGVRLAVREPSGSGDGMVAAAAVGEAVWLDKGMDASSLALAKLLPVARTVGGPLALPATAGEVGLVPEYALVPALGRLDTDTRTYAGTDRTAMLRFAWLPTADAAASPARADALGSVLRALQGQAGTRAIEDVGLRSPDGDAPSSVPAGRLPGAVAKPFDVFGRHHVEHVFATWYPQDRRVSLLIAVDVSGSMGGNAPGSTTPIIELVRRGCNSVGDLLPDDAQLGLWEFGVGPDAPRDYRQVLGMGQLSQAHRQAFGSSVRGLSPANNAVGLYNTILAAYIAARDAYRPGMPNQVLVFSDGKNDDLNSLTAAELSAKLGEARDPARPVQLSVAVFAKKAEADAIRAILRPVSGYVDSPATADEVAALFIHVAAGGLHPA